MGDSDNLRYRRLGKRTNRLCHFTLLWAQTGDGTGDPLDSLVGIHLNCFSPPNLDTH